MHAGAPRPVPGTTTPPSGAAVIPQTPRPVPGDDRTHSQAPAVKTPGRRDRPGDDRTHPQAPAVKTPPGAATGPWDDHTPLRCRRLNPRAPRNRLGDHCTHPQAPAVKTPGAPRPVPGTTTTHPQMPAVKPPPPHRHRGPRPPPPGKDARRNRHCGDGPLGILASPNGPPQFHPEDAERSEAQYYPYRMPVSVRNFARSWRADTRLTVPDRDRITSDSVVAPRSPW